MQATRMAASPRLVLRFYVIAFILSWGVWATRVAEARGLLGFHIPGKIAFFGVMFAAWLAAWWQGGRVGLHTLAARMLRWRVTPGWVAVALLAPVALAAISAGLYWVLGGSVAPGATLSLSAALLYSVTNTPFMLLTEETAWRGWALPALQARYSALTAALLVGVLWGVWHTPLFLIPDEPQAAMPYVAFVLYAVAQSILTTWVFNHTRGSVLYAALLHAVTDAALVYFGVVTGSAMYFWLATGVAWVAAMGIVWWYGPATLTRRPPDPAVGLDATTTLATTAAPAATLHRQ